MSVISVNNVEKKFKVYYDKGQSLKERLLFRNRNHYEDRWVLKGISFNVKKGEAIGLIGENGSGKSTLLKLMTKIMYPDKGNIEIQGRVSSLIELGAGFHPDMSGKENIYTNASIFGLSKKEIDKRLNDIIAFSELEEFIDNPVRTYSSGMYMRLAFSVAINVNADVLLIDEILAVGDANFQTKCFNKLREIKANGTTIIIVSHSLGQIEQICERSIWIQDGVIKSEGAPRTVHPEYMDYMGNKRKNDYIHQEEQVIGNKDKTDVENDVNIDSPENLEITDRQEQNNEVTILKRFGNGKARITSIKSVDLEGTSRDIFSTGEKVEFIINYKAREYIPNSIIGIGFIRNDGVYCYGTNTLIDRIEPYNLNGEGSIRINFDKLNLLPGIYNIDVAIEDETGIPTDFYREAHQIEMYSSIDDIGAIRIDHTWC